MLGLTNPEGVARRLERGPIFGVIFDVVDLHENVDDGLGRQIRDCSRSDVLYPSRSTAERRSQASTLGFEAFGPRAVVGNHPHRGRLPAADQNAIKFSIEVGRLYLHVGG
jgi:hypothetical protein